MNLRLNITIYIFVLQIIPVKINSQLFSRLRNNYVVVEVWTKVPSEQKFSDKLMGLVKIPLQLFYQSLKDSDIARYFQAHANRMFTLNLVLMLRPRVNLLLAVLKHRFVLIDLGVINAADTAAKSTTTRLYEISFKLCSRSYWKLVSMLRACS